MFWGDFSHVGSGKCTLSHKARMESSNSGSSVRRASEILESNNLVPNSLYDFYIWYIIIYSIFWNQIKQRYSEHTHLYVYIYTDYLSCPADDPGAPSWPSGNMSSQLLKDIRTHWLAPNLMQWLWAQLDGSSVSCYILLLGRSRGHLQPDFPMWTWAPNNKSAKSTMSPVRSGKVNSDDLGPGLTGIPSI